MTDKPLAPDNENLVWIRGYCAGADDAESKARAIASAAEPATSALADLVARWRKCAETREQVTYDVSCATAARVYRRLAKELEAALRRAPVPAPDADTQALIAEARGVIERNGASFVKWYAARLHDERCCRAGTPTGIDLTDASQAFSELMRALEERRPAPAADLARAVAALRAIAEAPHAFFKGETKGWVSAPTIDRVLAPVHDLIDASATQAEKERP